MVQPMQGYKHIPTGKVTKQNEATLCLASWCCVNDTSINGFFYSTHTLTYAQSGLSAVHKRPLLWDNNSEMMSCLLKKFLFLKRAS